MSNTAVSQPAQPPVSYLRQVLRNQSRVAYRDAILVAAESILLRDGFRRTKMVDIAEAAGVSVGTLYNYFESKDAMLQGLVEQYYLRLDERLNMDFDSEDPIQRLVQFTVRVHEFVEEHRTQLLAYSRTEFERRDSPKVSTRFALGSVLDRISPRIHALLEQCQFVGCLRTDVSPGVIGWFVESTLHALLLDWCREPQGFSPTHRAREVMALIIAGTASR